MQNHLVIFAKNPRIGRVKTRLARGIGNVAAWHFYRHMLATIPRALHAKGPWKTWMSVSPDQTKSRCFPPSKASFIDQGSGDLGARMMAPGRYLPPGPFLVIGTDVPDIKPSDIRQAFKLLGKNDIVFGPAPDGGFWLVGMKRHPYMVQPYRKKIRWSHAETLNDCLKNLEGAKIGYLRPLEDVDDQSSFQAFKRGAQGQ